MAAIGHHLSGQRSWAMKTVLYCRVSTIDQTVDHQLTQAQQAGFKPDVVLSDHGISGVSTNLSQRPQGRRLFDILREGDILEFYLIVAGIGSVVVPSNDIRLMTVSTRMPRRMNSRTVSVTSR
jgi:hypothetical protein